MSIEITYKQLVRNKACDSATSHFAHIFGSYAEVTVNNVVEHAEEFDFAWAIANLVDHSDIDECNSILSALDPMVSAAYRSVSGMHDRMTGMEYGSLKRKTATSEWINASNEVDKAINTIEAIVFFLAAIAYGLKS